MATFKPPPYEIATDMQVPNGYTSFSARVEVNANEETPPEVAVVATTADRNTRYDKPAMYVHRRI